MLMNLADLQRTIHDLESALDGLGVWLLVATVLVVLGLVLEYFHQIPESIREYKTNRSWGPIFIILGGILITLGVAGELFVQHLASGKETALRKANDQLFAQLNSEAAQARKDAGDAIESAAKADERASANEKESARLSKIAEAERLERIRLEAAVAPRGLTLDQQKRIADEVQKFRRHAVLVSSYGLDGEASELAAQVISSLRSVGITVADARASIVVNGGFETGVHVRGPDVERAFVIALGNALSVVGKLRVATNDPVPRTGGGIGGGGQGFTPGSVYVTVFVGVKPQPILSNNTR
jgi:hypothetical protein